MNDDVKSKFFRDLLGIESFKAQVALEEDTHNSLLSKLLTIDLSKSDVQLEYAKIRGAIEVLSKLKAARETLAERARSRQ